MATQMRILLILVILLLVGSLTATEISHPLSLGEAVDMALQNQPSTRQAWWNAKRAAAAVGIAKSAYYPKLDLQTYVTHGREFKFIKGPDTTFTILGADVLLSMMLFDFGETAASIKEAKMALVAANWQTEWNIQKVMVDVMERSYALVHAQEVLQAAIFSLEDTERMLNLAIELNRGGLTPISDVYIAKAGYAEMKIKLNEAKTELAIQRGKLAVSLGLSPDTDLLLAPIEPPQAQELQQITGMISLAYQQRADLMAKQATLAQSIANEAKVKASYFPKLRLLGKGGANHYVDDKANAGQYEVTLSLEAPLFTGFEATYQQRMALADSELSREELAQLQWDISLDVLIHSHYLQGAQASVCDAEEGLQNALKAYEGVLEIYRAGKERISAVSDVQRQLASARVRFSDIKTRWLGSIAKLAYATGTLAPYMEMETTCESNP